MQRSYDVVVIGGGIMGLATAMQLRQLGAGSVVLLERRFLGAGESGKSGKPAKNRKQAIAIGLSEARKKGAKVPAKSKPKKK